MLQPSAEESPQSLDRSRPRRLVWPWIARGLAAAAAGLCIYLAWAAMVAEGHVAGCGAGSDCGSVLASRWARWFDLPVAAPAAAVYGLLLAALCALPDRQAPGAWSRAWYALVPLAMLILTAAAWFGALQVLLLGKLCPYCLAVHGCAVVLALVLFWHLPHDWRLAPPAGEPAIGLKPLETLGLVMGGFLGIVVLIGGQLASKPASAELEITSVDATEAKPDAGGARDSAESMPTDLSAWFPRRELETAQAKPGPRRLALVGGKALLDVERIPLLGEPGAKIVVVELFDYTCPHCRRLHRYLSEARHRYGGQLAVAPLVTPMDPACNRHVHEAATEPGSCELARLAVAVWQVRPAAFAPFHDWMMAGETTRSLEAARQRAIDLLEDGQPEVVAQVLDRAVVSEAVTREIEADNRIYQLAGEGTIPKLVTDRTIIAGEPASAARLFEVLEGQVGLRPTDR